MNALDRFIARRLSLTEEYQRIMAVQREADALIEELRRRRDRERPSRLHLPLLREALNEVALSSGPVSVRPLDQADADA